MRVMFYAVPAFIAFVALFAAATEVRGTFRIGAAWRGGRTAEARCLRAYTTVDPHMDGDTRTTTTQHHVYEFTTRDGRTLRIEEEGGPATTVEGDVVIVHYRDSHPEQATAHPPRPVRLAAQTLGVLLFMAVVIGFCVFFVADLPTDDF
ncbi:DUF3592 domain-containing protein [Streptomyces sp. NPDC059524]|uniref:DUF3592 domain-containing protein n=1 Tax=Streptomyces sp. NPDC059524 TaxID=3346856 RepID=UPI0036D0A82D